MTWWAAPPTRAGPRRSSTGCGWTPAPNTTPMWWRPWPGSSPAGSPGPGPGLLYAARVAEIRAEMVANVWKVVAAQGQRIGSGDTVVILESMKMEIPVLAEDPGVLSKLNVAEGDVIQEGDLIAVID